MHVDQRLRDLPILALVMAVRNKLTKMSRPQTEIELMAFGLALQRSKPRATETRDT